MVELIGCRRITIILIIGVIAHTVYVICSPGMDDKGVGGVLRFAPLKWITKALETDLIVQAMYNLLPRDR